MRISYPNYLPSPREKPSLCYRYCAAFSAAENQFYPQNYYNSKNELRLFLFEVSFVKKKMFKQFFLLFLFFLKLHQRKAEAKK